MSVTTIASEPCKPIITFKPSTKLVSAQKVQDNQILALSANGKRLTYNLGQSNPQKQRILNKGTYSVFPQHPTSPSTVLFQEKEVHASSKQVTLYLFTNSQATPAIHKITVPYFGPHLEICKKENLLDQPKTSNFESCFFFSNSCRSLNESREIPGQIQLIDQTIKTQGFNNLSEPQIGKNGEYLFGHHFIDKTLDLFNGGILSASSPPPEKNSFKIWQISDGRINEIFSCKGQKFKTGFLNSVKNRVLIGDNQGKVTIFQNYDDSMTSHIIHSNSPISSILDLSSTTHVIDESGFYAQYILIETKDGNKGQRITSKIIQTTRCIEGSKKLSFHIQIQSDKSVLILGYKEEYLSSIWSIPASENISN